MVALAQQQTLTTAPARSIDREKTEAALPTVAAAPRHRRRRIEPSERNKTVESLHPNHLLLTGAIVMGAFISAGCEPGSEPMLLPSDGAPDHVRWARELVDNIDPEHNEYGTDPSFVHWAGVDGAHQYRNRSVCGTFLTLVLQRAYRLSSADIESWSGSASPNAARYHDAIAAGVRFEVIQDVNRIEPGDIVAIKYPAGSEVSGHVGIVAELPVRSAPAPPEIPGTTQYEVALLDSSSSGHGATDTRFTEDGSWHPGAGLGVLRIYADERGGLAGYTWSPHEASAYHPRSERDLVVGRLR
ncbi:hypothetical protein [Sorangium sp. So ce131]|uniref:hypothetical protein n=1 Tax=Sorangium sp. So ce131 TaxID=3133282 RepID=UPI003F616D72